MASTPKLNALAQLAATAGAHKARLLVYGLEHKMGVRVPKGGSSCGNCRFGKTKRDGPHCTNARWVDWPKRRGGGGGESHLPVQDPTTYCCDLWERA